MSQDWTIDDIDKAVTSPADDINGIKLSLEALRSQFSGTTRPLEADLTAGQTWLDTDYTVNTWGLYTVIDPANSALDALSAVISTTTGAVTLVSAGELLATVTQVEAEAGTATTQRLWTAERMKQAIAALSNPIPTNITHITASGTYTKPAGLVRAKVRCQAGGGGGGGTPDTEGQSSGGGAGGGYGEIILEAASIGATETLTIGVGGVGGTGTGEGTVGGTSSFGAHISCTGGDGGWSADQAGADYASGGVSTGGTINVAGGYGTEANRQNATRFGTGDSVLGAGAIPPANGSNGVDATGHGGGGGASDGNTSATFTGGSGTQGIIIVEEFF